MRNAEAGGGEGEPRRLVERLQGNCSFSSSCSTPRTQTNLEILQWMGGKELSRIVVLKLLCGRTPLVLGVLKHPNAQATHSRPESLGVSGGQPLLFLWFCQNWTLADFFKLMYLSKVVLISVVGFL